MTGICLLSTHSCSQRKYAFPPFPTIFHHCKITQTHTHVPPLSSSTPTSFVKTYFLDSSWGLHFVNHIRSSKYENTEVFLLVSLNKNLPGILLMSQGQLFGGYMGIGLRNKSGIVPRLSTKNVSWYLYTLPPLYYHWSRVSSHLQSGKWSPFHWTSFGWCLWRNCFHSGRSVSLAI